MHERAASPLRLTDDELARVLAHPLRMRVLRILNERTASPVEVARELGEPLNTVAYHVRALLKADCVELVRRRQRRGAVEHFYRATARSVFSADQLAGLPPSLRRQALGGAVADAFAPVAAAGTVGGFDESDVHVSWTPMALDEEAWGEVSALLAGVLERLPALQAQAAARRAAAGDDAEPPAVRPAGVVLMHFECVRPDCDPPADGS